MYYEDTYSSGLADFFSGGFLLFTLIICVIELVAFWKIFTKAGRPGWYSIIPFYSNYQYSMITFGSWGPFVLLFVPVVNSIVLMVLQFKLSKVFGKSTVFAILSVFFPYIALPILGFGSATYLGPNGELTYNKDPRANNEQNYY